MTALAANAPSSGWMRSRRFDVVFLFVVPALAIVLGAFGLIEPRYFTTVLLIDLWFVSFPHVAATFTRIAFSRADARENALLLLALPPAAVLLAIALVHVGGMIALSTVYFFWQSFHYARQSYGIDRAYRRRVRARADDPLGDAVIFLVPLWGVLRRCAQQPASFLGMPLWLPAIPHGFVTLTGLVALAAFVAWVVRQSRALQNGDSRETARALYVLTHVTIFVASYVAITDITRGWIVVNVWHNAQYLLFVWAQNQRRFDDRIDPQRRVLSWLSHRNQVLPFATVCLALGAVGYFALFRATGARDASHMTAASLIAVHAVNIHHYVVDAVIWRSRRQPNAA